MIAKFMLVKCAGCGETLDEASDTIYYYDDKPLCFYCHEEQMLEVMQHTEGRQP